MQGRPVRINPSTDGSGASARTSSGSPKKVVDEPVAIGRDLSMTKHLATRQT
jgi:hypothetical protein